MPALDMAISCDPVDLVAEARCFQCSDGVLGSAMAIESLCQWAQGGQTPSAKYIAGEGTGEIIQGEGGGRIVPEDV